MCPRFSSETSDGLQGLISGYFRACDPPGVLTSIYKDPAEPGRQAYSGAEGKEETEKAGGKTEKRTMLI